MQPPQRGGSAALQPRRPKGGAVAGVVAAGGRRARRGRRVDRHRGDCAAARAPRGRAPSRGSCEPRCRNRGTQVRKERRRRRQQRPERRAGARRRRHGRRGAAAAPHQRRFTAHVASHGECSAWAWVATATLTRCNQCDMFYDDGPWAWPTKRLLMAFAATDTSCGWTYTSGMSFLAAAIVRGMIDAEPHARLRAFCWVLRTHPVSCYWSDVDRWRAEARFAAFGALLRTISPRLHDHLASAGAEPAVYLPTWLLQLFFGYLSLEALDRVWDAYLFAGGGFFGVRVALALLRVKEAQLLAADSLASIAPLLTGYDSGRSVDGGELLDVAAHLPVTEAAFDALVDAEESALRAAGRAVPAAMPEPEEPEEFYGLRP